MMGEMGIWAVWKASPQINTTKLFSQVLKYSRSVQNCPIMQFVLSFEFLLWRRSPRIIIDLSLVPERATEKAQWLLGFGDSSFCKTNFERWDQFFEFSCVVKFREFIIGNSIVEYVAVILSLRNNDSMTPSRFLILSSLRVLHKR